ncbi:NUDIX domain-containing protein [Streptomyces chiangmaiensis]|uniref:NUDIX domain-containing protein n=1 Tax=Streptomyces chiangmaiensis TaxID=766497 RepID=A0ABU7FPB7_9ACTN|nr:NUDIX domain-containing protein [Streptomyces chiangmaiensis]MED7825683.1 NUDIX domain-containing protein [Streptomyces chiangmaiensis]
MASGPHPVGSLEEGEDHATATLRELREELGIDEATV